jgi:hypothetical protein
MTYATRDDLDTLTTLVVSTARAAERATHAAESVCAKVDDLTSELKSYTAGNNQRMAVQEDRLTNYIFESQRLLTRDGERIAIQEGQNERLEAIAANLTRSNEHTQQLIQIQQQRMELQQQQLDLQRQRLDTQDETLRSINAAVERLEAIVTRLMD